MNIFEDKIDYLKTDLRTKMTDKRDLCESICNFYRD
jgi:hypothetical protein